MKRALFSLLLMLSVHCLWAAKTVYIPTYWANDTYLKNWSNSRLYQSANFAVFWGADAGTNPAGYTGTNASLKFNPALICDTLEKIYTKYITTIGFCSDASTTNLGKYKIIIVMTNTWGTGGPNDFAYATSFDNTIGGLFVDASATLDGGVTSHEFTHTLQFMQAIQENPNSGGAFQNNDLCGFFFETHANFMRAQMYPQDCIVDLPRWIGTGMFHWSSTRHHYDAFDLLFYMQQVDGITMVNRLWKESIANEHPLMTYKRLKGWTQAQLNSFIYDYAKRQVTFDYTANNYGNIMRGERDRIRAQEPDNVWRPYTILKQVDSATGRYIVPDAFAPQDYGFNVIPLYTTCSSKSVTVKFKGHTEVNSTAGWNYGFVTTNSDGTVSRYGTVNTANESEISFQLNSSEAQMYLVVIGAPTTHTSYVWEAGWPRIKRYPYELRIANAVPEGFQSGYRSSFKTSGSVHANGGGWVASTATVASSVYVGPKALVMGSSNITGNARIDGTAWVDNATVSNNVIINGNAMVNGGTYSGSPTITDNVVLNSTVVSGTATFKTDALEFGGTFGSAVVVGGDAEIVSCSNGVYLQTPDPHTGNQRTDCDGKGATDPTNIDVNASYSNFTAAQMAFSTTIGCSVASAAPVAGTVYKITNKNSGKSFCIQGVSTANSALLTQYTYQGGTHQQFKVDTAGGGSYFKLSPMHVTGKVLDVNGKSTADGASIIQYTWTSTSTNQQWTFVDAGSGYFNIKSRSSGKCMGVSGSSLNDDVAIQQFTCSTTDASQLFTFTDITTITAASTAQATTVSPQTVKPAGLYVYPNPARSVVTVELAGFSAGENVLLYLYDIGSGKMIMSNDLQSNRQLLLSVDALHLSPGVYLIKVAGSTQVLTQKLLILK